MIMYHGLKVRKVSWPVLHYFDTLNPKRNPLPQQEQVGAGEEVPVAQSSLPQQQQQSVRYQRTPSGLDLQEDHLHHEGGSSHSHGDQLQMVHNGSNSFGGPGGTLQPLTERSGGSGSGGGLPSSSSSSSGQHLPAGGTAAMQLTQSPAVEISAGIGVTPAGAPTPAISRVEDMAATQDMAAGR